MNTDLSFLTIILVVGLTFVILTIKEIIKARKRFNEEISILEELRNLEDKNQKDKFKFGK